MRRAQPAPRSTLAFRKPCQPRLGPPPEGADWIHEIKYDGYRVQVLIEGEGHDRRVRIYTRNGLDWTERFAALLPALRNLPGRAIVIDGEAVAFEENGTTTLRALQHALRAGARGELALIAFDLLHIDGTDLAAAPLAERKARLHALLAVTRPDRALRESEHLTGSGPDIFAKACALGLEGLVSKRLDRPYRSGRGDDWIKSKCVAEDAFVVIGFVPSEAAPGIVGSLVVGYHDQAGALRYAGRVGTGFDADEARAMADGLAAITSPAPDLARRLTPAQRQGVRWIAPQLVVSVAYRGFTGDGLLRAASFKGFREDEAVSDVGPPEGAPPP